MTMTLGTFFGGFAIAYGLCFVVQQLIRGLYSLFIRYVLS
jgi:hypothetical protein